MWEVLSFGDKPYGEMSNQEVSPGAPHTVLLPTSSYASSYTPPYFFFLTQFFCTSVSPGPL